jgi:hypothetical protein
MDHEEFGFNCSKRHESFKALFDSLKRVEIGSPIDLESKIDCPNSREHIAFIDCSGRYDNVKSDDSEAGDDP